jgi:hypothetical protein
MVDHVGTLPLRVNTLKASESWPRILHSVRFEERIDDDVEGQAEFVVTEVVASIRPALGHGGQRPIKDGQRLAQVPVEAFPESNEFLAPLHPYSMSLGA